MTRHGPVTELPAGWTIEIQDQGEQIDEVWLVLRGPETKATKVFSRTSQFGAAVIGLDLAR